MIGFGQQKVMRRPVYSDMGTKLGYIVSGPDGEWWTSVGGRRIGRIKKIRPTRAKDISTCVSGSATISADETWEY
jgi:hypothetical protein